LTRQSKVSYLPKDMRWRGALLLVTADTPAAALIGGFKKSVGTKTRCFCRHCVITHDKLASQDSFSHRYEFRNCASHKGEVDAQSKCIRQGRRDDRKELSRLSGVCADKKDSHCFVWPVMPWFDVSTCIPNDLMHVELEGELKWITYVTMWHCVKTKIFSVAEMNDRMRSWLWKKDPEYTSNDRPLPFAPHRFEGADFFAKKSCPKMSAGQLLCFTRHAIGIFKALMPNFGQDPVTAHYILHRDYFMELMKHEIKREDVPRLHEMIVTAHDAYSKLSLARIHPKTHYSTHFKDDIYNFGPPRHYWTMRCEAKHKCFKRYARMDGQWYQLRPIIARRHQRNVALGSEPACNRLPIPACSVPDVHVEFVECDVTAEGDADIQATLDMEDEFSHDPTEEDPDVVLNLSDYEWFPVDR
jgi:hypothetical protein